MDDEGMEQIEEKPVDVQSVLEYDLTESEGGEFERESCVTSPAKRAQGGIGEDQSPKIIMSTSVKKGKSHKFRQST